MSDKNLQDIKDTITESGKALLSYSKTGSAFLPLDGDMYVAVGTLAGIASVAGKEVGESAPAAAGIEGLTRYAPRVNLLDSIAWMEADAEGGYVKFADVERLLGAHAGVEAVELPAILFDGHSVFQEITAHLGKEHCYSPDAVSATLDAVVRLIRKDGAAPAAQAPVQNAEEVRRAALEEAITVCKRNKDWRSVDAIRALQCAQAEKVGHE